MPPPAAHVAVGYDVRDGAAWLAYMPMTAMTAMTTNDSKQTWQQWPSQLTLQSVSMTEIALPGW